MPIRNVILFLLLGVPTIGLLLFGPRGAHDAPPDRTVVRYWEKWTGVEGVAMRGIVDRFNATVGADKGIWVEYCAISNVDQRTLIATAGGDPPDVAGLYDHIVAQFADQGALLPLDNVLARSTIDPDAFEPIWRSLCTYQGKLYGLPAAPYTIALYYNRTRFREAGLDPNHPPQTIAELDDFSLRLTERDEEGKIIRTGFTPAPALLGWWHWVWPYFFDGRLWDGESFHLDTPAGNGAMAWIANRREKLGVEDMLDFEGVAGAIESADNPFLSGRIAMVFQGPWMSTWIKAYAPDLDYGVAAFPSVTAEQQNVFASTDVFVIPEGARHPDEALVFLEYVLRPEITEELAKAHGKLSPYRDPSPDFYDTHPHKDVVRVFAELARSPYTFGHPKMPTFAQASTEMLFMLETVMQGERNPNDAVRATQARVDDMVRKYQHMQGRRHAQGGDK